MKNYIKILFLFFAFFISFSVKAQNEIYNGIYIIDSYVTPEKPYKFLVSFVTDDSAKTNLVINDKYKFVVSKDFSINHKIELDLSNIKLDSSNFVYYIQILTKNEEEYKSEQYEAELPQTLITTTTTNSNIFTTCLFGSIIFLIPEPTYVYMPNFNSFSFKKEIPLLTYHLGGYNYPTGYFNVEYRHITKNHFNTFGIGYKHIVLMPVIEYISVGVTGFTNFKSKNGLIPEISLGLFKLYDNFTFNVKYRYNIKPNEKEFNFNEISVGLFSNFFSLNL